MRRKAFQWFTIVLLLVSIWTVYANVLSDDAAVRTKARATAETALKCDGCKLEGMRGERGMLDETIGYDFLGKGHVVVACRRAFIVAGDYACEATSAPSTPGTTK
jgi:hypothetical protein